ncbi:protein of unknown function (plasmid) [Paraburkholderia dioscoreae]|uniref:Uncharacterized protein n=1 Tax=Paraburkholderia dioscoreae TaxID=2604047 RepID=A0A5Q4ZI28_9BURK|nr:protein of unknown function [Paraburkholderia dioscoreae]
MTGKREQLLSRKGREHRGRGFRQAGTQRGKTPRAASALTEPLQAAKLEGMARAGARPRSGVAPRAGVSRFRGAEVGGLRA